MADARMRPEDRFFRHIVSSMRNGVIAFRRDGTLALMNADGYRIFGLTPSPDDVGRPFADVLATCPEIIRVLSGAFELSHLPNRAELRLKELDRVIGYTLSQVKDDDGSPIGAVLFFKDLTQVEQLEERERLRDRLASLGEMAAGIAHELEHFDDDRVGQLGLADDVGEQRLGVGRIGDLTAEQPSHHLDACKRIAFRDAGRDSRKGGSPAGHARSSTAVAWGGKLGTLTAG